MMWHDDASARGADEQPFCLAQNATSHCEMWIGVYVWVHVWHIGMLHFAIRWTMCEIEQLRTCFHFETGTLEHTLIYISFACLLAS